MSQVRSLIDELAREKSLPEPDLLFLLDHLDEQDRCYLTAKAHQIRLQAVGNQVYLRGLIEFTSYCRQNCLYCGIRSGNRLARRYRLTAVEILAACQTGYDLGYRTFVLQGGEDPFFTDDKMAEMIHTIKTGFPQCALTLSLGEKNRASYQKYYNAGADRYLLRHETAAPALYASLHPGMSWLNRRRCLEDLQEIGFQVGAGFMVGLPGQTNGDLLLDLLFLAELQPQMVGVGPYICHPDTPLAGQPSGSLEKTLTMLSLVRLMLPKVLLPATTALGTLDQQGREKGLMAGANVVMPNLSPQEVRHKYALYAGKICTGEEAAECRQCIAGRIELAGFQADFSRGDYPAWMRKCPSIG